ncbi:Cro/CI family transcriptional regulator [Klebsiella pneumoniae]|uniref:Transcriptional regulator n=2 Tax=Klebsiella TaxID=570 RepID=A0A483MQQ4_KLEPN|nr:MULTISPECIES: Cro/CI family transcriptional regulator [Klebsiella/Raoultella group]MCF8599161.1 Cro/CI family transcriptional regulator [Klebsiella sp. 2019SCSN059]QBP08170.1 regulatory protein Cro [Klebsiella phage ST405-OXA48phi1.2]DAY60811.1 MAG TPA: DNA-binding transcriptional regulator [Caudoviricetes sp.]HBQ3182620.1 transcriptional regulator [Klebsiella variicola subsp. variicola]HBW8913469.1 transcriptional regulator [Klebsiella pneumoniae subsp. pneumoniae 1158]
MFKQDAINYFGSKSKLAKAAGVAPASVSVWGELVPEKNAMRLQLASGGVLQYDPEVYDQHAKAKRSGEVNHENQA